MGIEFLFVTIAVILFITTITLTVLFFVLPEGTDISGWPLKRDTNIVIIVSTVAAISVLLSIFLLLFFY